MENLTFVVAIVLLIGVVAAKEDFIEQNSGIIGGHPGLNSNPSQTDDSTSHIITPDKLDWSKMESKSEKFNFQTKVNRMMKLIINSLYRNKEIFLRELISNASDALDKIRLLALTDKNIHDINPEMSIKIEADKTNKILSIMDTGIGMTKQDLINNLGTIANSGTAEFLNKMQTALNATEMNDMIGQFGVGFYSAFLVANKVVVVTKHNEDKQYIWESDSTSFSIVEDPRSDTLKRGTIVSLYLKDEAEDFLESDTIQNLIKKYSQFINFPIYLRKSKVVETEEEVSEKIEMDKENKIDEDVEIEEDAKEKSSKKIKKTEWYWELLNDSKPIWTQKPSEVTDDEYNNFYKALTKDSQNPLTKIHFSAEGEVTFKSLLFIPALQPSDSFNRYGTKSDNIKLYVRRVCINDKFNDLLPNYLAFVQGIVDSDDLPLNVSRETLQQHKLIKIIKKRLIRKVLDTIKKIAKEVYPEFWKEYSTNIKLGIIEDSQNRARLSKLLMFHSSAQDNLTSLTDYVSRIKPNQKYIYYIAGSSLSEVKMSPFIENLLKKGYEVLYLVEAVDEHALSFIPEFEGMKFQNVAKDGFSFDDDSKSNMKKQRLAKTFEPLTKYLTDLLKNYVNKVQVSDRLVNSSCALVASMFGWTGNMERLAISNAHQKTEDSQKSYYLNQKKMLEINPRHPLIKELLFRIEQNEVEESVKDMSLMLFHTATLRSGYMLKDSVDFVQNVEKLMQKSLGISVDEPLEDDSNNFEDSYETDKDFKNINSEEQIEDHDEL